MSIENILLTLSIAVLLAMIFIIRHFLKEKAETRNATKKKPDTENDLEEIDLKKLQVEREESFANRFHGAAKMSRNAAESKSGTLDMETENIMRETAILCEKQRVAKARKEIEDKLALSVEQNCFLNSNTYLFGIYFLFASISSVVGSFLLDKVFPHLGFTINGIVTALIIFICFVAFILNKSIASVPENSIWLLTVFEKYVKSLKPGLNFIFPYFTGANEIFLGIQEEELFSEGNVDFKDSASKVNGQFLYKVINPRKAWYGLDNTIATLKDKLDEATRSYLSKKTMDEAIVLRAELDLKTILNGKIGEDHDDIAKNLVFREILEVWGIEVTQLLIIDIELPKALEEIRDDLLKKNKLIELTVRDEELADKEQVPAITRAKTEQKVTIEIAKGRKKAIQLTGEGHSMAAKELKDIGVTPDVAVDFLEKELKWQTVGPNVSTIITEGHNETASGARFGAGFKDKIMQP